jgi:hypothetical protein
VAKDDVEVEDVVTEALERFEECENAWSTVRSDGLADARFALLGEQWPDEIQTQRLRDGRPCLTLNNMLKFVRQVTNDARQNKPQVQIRAMSNGADQATAEIYAGIIKQIESTSDADIAYDTGAFGAVTQGIGFWRIDIDQACNDSFDYDLAINRIDNPQSVLFDPMTQAADASDWRFAFIYDDMEIEAFKAAYPDADPVNFTESGQTTAWLTEDHIRTAEYWTREKITKTIWKMSNGQVLDEELLKNPDVRSQLSEAGITAITSRQVPSYEVTHRLMTGRQELQKNKWAGTLIPIVPVYGEEFNIEGRRYWRSLIHHGKDAQRNFNYWRSASTEMIALAPKAPWVGPQGFVGTGVMAEKWNSANTENHNYLEYDPKKTGGVPPQRTEFAGVPAGILNETTLAANDMRDIIGMSNPALGVQQEFGESGRALRMRRAEADTGTLHFHDNVMRAVRYSGRVLVELIPKVYNTERTIRILGKDGAQQMVNIGPKNPLPPGVQPPPGYQMNYDLTVGKYDVAVDVGPSYATQREQAAESMTAFVQAFPQAAPILGDMIARNSDWPDAAKVAKRMEALLPPNILAMERGEPPPPPQPPPEVLAEQAKAESSFKLAQQKAQLDAELSQRKAQNDAQLEQQAAQNRTQIEREQAQADIAVMQMKAQADIEIERQKAAVQLELKRQEAELEYELRQRDATLQEHLSLVREFVGKKNGKAKLNANA